MDVFRYGILFAASLFLAGGVSASTYNFSISDTGDWESGFDLYNTTVTDNGSLTVPYEFVQVSGSSGDWSDFQKADGFDVYSDRIEQVYPEEDLTNQNQKAMDPPEIFLNQPSTGDTAVGTKVEIHYDAAGKGSSVDLFINGSLEGGDFFDPAIPGAFDLNNGEQTTITVDGNEHTFEVEYIEDGQEALIRVDGTAQAVN